MKAPTKTEANRPRDQRLRAALRQNLKRRKEQARGRAAGPQDAPLSEGPAAEREKDGPPRS